MPLWAQMKQSCLECLRQAMAGAHIPPRKWRLAPMTHPHPCVHCKQELAARGHRHAGKACKASVLHASCVQWEVGTAAVAADFALYSAALATPMTETQHAVLAAHYAPYPHLAALTTPC